MSDAGLEIRVAGRVGALGIDVAIEAGPGPLVVLGPNGAGKTSLLAMVLGLARPERGRVAIGGDVVFDADRGIDVPVEARRVGWVPAGGALFPHLDVRGHLAFAARAARLRSDDAEATVAGLVRDLELTAITARRPHALSSGERQRVALARALASRPRALVLDEPLAALDVGARAAVRTWLRALVDRLALPAIVVTHDPLDARALGGTITILEEGRVAQQGGWAVLSAAPATPFVEAIVASAGA